jgi:hypothetical protein
MNRSALILAAGLAGLLVRTVCADLESEFKDPPFHCQSRPLWFWNGPLQAGQTRSMLAACKERGYYGVGILPAHGMTPAFMTPEFLEQYQVAVEEAAKLGMKLCLYDEYWFPSGSAGGLLAKRFPEALSQRLDLLAVDVAGPKEFAQALPSGAFMGAVAMERRTKERLNISDRVEGSQLSWTVPAGDWKIMVFTCVRDGAGGLVNYLDPQAVQRFITLTYQAYYDQFPTHFGTTIDSAFYDEPTFHWIQGGRAWTEKFNEKYREKRGTDPVLDYPALWFDIGPETAAARNALFGFRAELYSTGFPKVLNDWCRAHRLQLTGHVDQEEIVNPVGLCGDLMKAFRHQDIPAIDQVFQYGRASRAYKVVSSAAFNYDRPQVLTECYGGINNMPPANLYKEAMDQFAKGINTMVPHAVWYEPKKIIFQPDLSPSSLTYGPHLLEFNRYIGRLQRMLQGGRHVADIAVLYPIATLQAGYYFGPGKPYEGGVIPPEADYMEVGEQLSLAVRRDFTFLHPEILEERCEVVGAELRLNNRTNAESYKVVVLPGSRAVQAGSLQKVKAFYQQGGTVIATTRLPDTSAEPGRDAEVRDAVSAMFGAGAGQRSAFPRTTASSEWIAGGYEAARAFDGDPDTRWNAADRTKGGQWLEVDFGAATAFTQTVIREAFGRIRAYRIECWDGAQWNECARGQAAGPEKTNTFSAVTASKVRLFVESIASDSVSISEFEVRDERGRNLAGGPPGLTSRTNAQGGRAYFLPFPKAALLKTVLDEALPLADVRFAQEVMVSGGNLSYIHKVMEGRDVFFFGNSSANSVDCTVQLRGNLELEQWDPHTGRIVSTSCAHGTAGGRVWTDIRLVLPPVQSRLFVGAGR